jgi:hypothetical protein
MGLTQKAAAVAKMTVNRMDGREYRENDSDFRNKPWSQTGRWPANLILSYPEDEYDARRQPAAQPRQRTRCWRGFR